MQRPQSMSRTAALAVVVSLVLTVAGCAAATASVSVSNGAVSVKAAGLVFDVGTIHAQAGEAFTIHFTNAEARSHNIAVFSPSGSAIGKTAIITGPGATADLPVPALQPGTYSYRCEVHPTQMNGSIVVGTPGATSS